MSLDDDDVEYVKRQYLRCTPMAKLVFPVPPPTGPAQPTRIEPSCSTGAVVEAGDKTVLDMLGTPIPVINLDANSLTEGNRKRPMARESSDVEEIVDSPLNRTYSAPSQDALRKEINTIKVEIQNLLLNKDAGLDDGRVNMELENLEKRMKEKESELRVKKQNAKRQRKLRDRRKGLAEATAAKVVDESEMNKKLEALEKKLKKKEAELRVKRKNAMRAKRWRDRRRGLAGLTEAQQKMREKDSQLKVKEKSAIRLRKWRARRREILAEAMIKNPDLDTRLRVPEELARPRLEEDQPELLKAIVNLVPFGASAKDMRRRIILRTCRTLSDLRKELEKIGFTVSQTATYLRLVPKKTTPHEGKKHVMTVPVRLFCPQADLRKAHIDQNFCKATIQGVETLATILGPDQVIFISQDDKARVSLGVTAVNKQAPVLMHLDYQIRLPDHDWVIAERHKLVPSVYAYNVIKPHSMDQPDAVSYSGPTYIAIRSGKHSSSTVSAHAADFEKILGVQCFHDLMANDEGVLKPVVILSVDGGPEENPRCPKVIAHAIDHFQKHNLDALYMFTNAPGTSAHGRVERRMAPLSKELAGVVLEHQHFGSHLNVNGKTVDPQLEVQNLAHAGGVLADIWNGLVLDGHKVFAEYIQPEEALSVPALPPADWYAQHVRESQYLLQIVKCTDSSCCKEARSGLRRILPDGFLPPPYSLVQTARGPEAPQPTGDGNDRFASLLLRSSVTAKPNHAGFAAMPYDFFCPSISDQLRDRTCNICDLYFASEKAVAYHKSKVHSIATPADKVPVRRVITRHEGELLCQLTPDTMEWVAEEDVKVEVTQGVTTADGDSDSDLPLIERVNEWNKNPFVDDNIGFPE